MDIIAGVVTALSPQIRIEIISLFSLLPELIFFFNFPPPITFKIKDSPRVCVTFYSFPKFKLIVIVYQG